MDASSEKLLLPHASFELENFLTLEIVSNRLNKCCPFCGVICFALFLFFC